MKYTGNESVQTGGKLDKTENCRDCFCPAELPFTELVDEWTEAKYKHSTGAAGNRTPLKALK